MRVLINPAQCPLRCESDPIAALPQSDAMGQNRKTKKGSLLDHLVGYFCRRSRTTSI